jgi:hypothetical protein
MSNPFQSVISGQVDINPYPHVIVENALPTDIFNALRSNFPDLNTLSTATGDKEVGYDISAYGSDLPQHLPAEHPWVKFVQYLASGEFFMEFVRVFRPSLEKFYPDLLEKAENRKIVIQPRHSANAGGDGTSGAAYKIALESVVRDNFSFQERSMRGPHMDHAHKIFSALLYLRDDADTSDGGEFGLFAEKKSGDVVPNLKTTIVDSKHDIDWERVELVKKVPYKANTFLCFLNTAYSIHGVMPRSSSRIPRRLVYMNADVLTPVTNERVHLFKLRPRHRSFGGTVEYGIRSLLRMN